MDSTQLIKICRDGKEVGIYTTQEVYKLWADGKILPTDQLFSGREGSPEWQLLRDEGSLNEESTKQPKQSDNAEEKAEESSCLGILSMLATFTVCYAFLAVFATSAVIKVLSLFLSPEQGNAGGWGIGCLFYSVIFYPIGLVIWSVWASSKRGK
jgi:hypothetical protein